MRLYLQNKCVYFGGSFKSTMHVVTMAVVTKHSQNPFCGLKKLAPRQARQVNLASLKPLLPMLDSHSIFEQILEISLFIYFVFWGVTGVFSFGEIFGDKGGFYDTKNQ